MGSFPQQLIEVLIITRLRDRCQVIPPEVASFSFHATFLVAPRRIAKLSLVAPVRSEGNESRRFLPLRSPQDSLHRRLEIVIAADGRRLRNSEMPVRAPPRRPVDWHVDRRGERLPRSPCCVDRISALSASRRPTRRTSHTSANGPHGPTCTIVARR